MEKTNVTVILPVYRLDEITKELPIFEIRSTQDFPLEQTFIPIMKRKIMAYVFQIVNLEKINNFDSEL